MKNVLAIALAFVASAAVAAPLTGTLTLVDAANATIVDAGTFGPIPGGVDVYEVSVDNPNANDVSAIGLDLQSAGLFLNGTTIAKQGAGLPTFGPFTTADSTFNSPVAVGDLLGAGLLQDASNFVVNYSIAGGGVFIPAGGSAVVATLAVPAGAPLDDSAFSGNVEFTLGSGAVGEPIVFGNVIPEPTTALLAGLALVGFVARRK